MTARVKEILSWYGSEPPGVKANLYRLLMQGALAGTGRMVILPIDQGFEHGPARSFAPNPPAYDPRYHFELAIEAGLSAYAAPPGCIAVGADEFAGRIPLILKLNSSDSLLKDENPCPSLNADVSEALRLGCIGVGLTIYPGSGARNTMYQQVREVVKEARAAALLVVVWSYPRGAGLSKDGETAIDVVAYGAQIAAQLGAHIIKVKPPTEKVEQEEARKVYRDKAIPVATLPDRVRHVVQSCLGGRRVVIFSGMAMKSDDEVLGEVKQVHEGGGFGSIMGRNAFQRPKDKAVKLLRDVVAIYKG